MAKNEHFVKAINGQSGFVELGGGSGVAQRARVTLNAAQIRALPTTPFKLIQGTAGKLLMPVVAVLRAHSVGEGFANVAQIVNNPAVLIASGTDEVPENSDLTSYGGMIDTSEGGLGTQGVDTFSSVMSCVDGTALVLVSGQQISIVNTHTNLPQSISQATAAPADGESLFLIVNNGALGNFTGGDNVNTIDVTILYFEL